MTTLRILHLEDNPADAELIARALRQGGIDCTIEVVDHRAAFVAALETQAPDVILADYTLPDLDGLAAQEIARTLRPDVPAVFVTGTLGEIAAVELLKRGASDYVLKHNTTRLVPAVRRALKEAADLRARRELVERLEATAREQTAVAALGADALAGAPPATLMATCCALVRDALGSDLAAVLRCDPDGRFTMIAGSGWPAEHIGAVVVPGGMGSQAGFTIDTGAPVIVEDLASETRFVVADTLRASGAVSGLSVAIPSGDGIFGVLSTHARRHRAFVAEDVGFLSSIAHILGQALARQTATLKANRLTRLYTVLAEANESIVRASNEDDLFREICSLIVDHSDVELVMIATRGTDSGLATRAFAAAADRDWEPLLHHFCDECPGVRSAIESGVSSLSGAPEEGTSTRCVQLALEAGLPSRGAFPFGTVDDGPSGVLVALAPANAYFDHTEATLFEDLAADLGFAVRSLAQERAQHEAEDALARHDAILSTVASVAQQLLHSGSWRDCLPDVLHQLGEAAQASRVRLFSVRSDARPELATIEHEWVGPGTPPTMEGTLIDIPYIDIGLGRWADVMRRDGYLAGRSSDFPDRERMVLDMFGVQSLVMVAIFVEGRDWGFLSFDDCDSGRTWSHPEIDALRAAAEMLGVSIQRDIADSALRESEERFRQLADNVDVAFFVLDLRNGRLLYENEASERLSGISREDAIVDPLGSWINVVHPDDLERVSRGLVSPSGTEAEVEYRIIHPQRGVRWMHARLNMIPNDQGEAHRLAGLIEDVTERKEAEELLAAREQRFTALVRESTDVIALLDSELRLTYASPAASRIFGLDITAHLGQSVLDLIHQDDVAAVSEKLADAMREPFPTATSREHAPIILRMRHADGSWRTIEATATNRLNDPVVRALVVNARDITERLQAEQVLAAAQSRFVRTLEDMNDGFLLLELDGTITYTNPRAEVLLERAADDLNGKRVFEAYPDMAEQLSAQAESVFVRGQSTSFEAYLDRHKKWFDIDVYVFEDGISVYFRDITERKHAADELQHSFELLQRTDAQRRTLLAHLVHAQEEERQRIAADIHDDSIQAMTALAIRLQTLRRKLVDPELVGFAEQLEETARDTITRLRRLMFDLRPPALDQQGLSGAVRGSLEQLRSDNGVDFDLESAITSEPPPDIRATIFRIAQEALSNVKKHAHAHVVRVVLKTRGRGLLVKIADDGCGFRPESSSPKPGHLGLVSMRERAEMSGGWWRIESTDGAGTTVEYWLPTDTNPGMAA